MTERRALTRAALVVSGGILLSRLLGFLRDVAMAALLGRGIDADLYADAFLIPDYLFFLMAGGYLSITLVPILMSEEAATGGAREAFTAVFRAVGVALMLITLVALAAAGPIAAAIFPEVPEIARLTGLTRIALASQVFFGLGTLLMAAQYARQRFLIPTMAPLIYNLGIIFGGLAGAAAGNPSPEAFLWGGLAGAAIGNFGLQAWGAARSGMTLESGVPWKHHALGQYLAMAFPLMIGQTAVALDEQWPRIFGQFVSEGATAGLAYARRLTMVPVGVIAQAAGVAAYPFLARLVAERRTDDLRATVSRSATAAWTLGALAAAAVAGLATPIVRLAYQRGEFTTTDTSYVAPLLAFYAISIPFWGAHQVITRAFYARRHMWLPVGIGTAVTAVTIPALMVAARFDSPLALAAVSSGSIAVYTIAVLTVWKRREPTPLPGLVRSLLAAGVAYLAAFGVSGIAGAETAGAAALSIAAGSVAALLTFWLVLWVSGVPEATMVLRRLTRR